MDAFTTAYIECALWSSTDEDGEPLDDYCDIEDVATETITRMQEECADFQEDMSETLVASGLSDEQAGHDFWLTRNGHGTGFWDRGLPEAIGEALTKEAKSYGPCDLYVGDDGKVYAF